MDLPIRIKMKWILSTYTVHIRPRLRDTCKLTVLRIHLILMRRIRILDSHWKKWISIRIQVVSLKFTGFLNKAEFSIFCLIFFAYFYAKLYKAFRNQEIFIISLFQWFKFGFWSKHFVLQFLADILLLGSGSWEPHIFADPDPES